VLEDTVLFARCLALQLEMGVGTLADAFARSEALRRARIDAAYKESSAVVKTVLDAGALGHTIKCFVVPYFLAWTRAKRERHFVEDVTSCSLEVGPEREKGLVATYGVPVGAAVAVAAAAWWVVSAT
jgi:salicylate hydroxylase